MVQKFYEKADVIGSSARLPRTRIAHGFAQRVRAQRALDIGSGDGEASLALAKATGAEVVCADISEMAIESCRARGLEGHVVRLGEERLPFADARFDVVVMTEVIEHLVWPETALKEIHRVLRPDGHLILSTPNLACLPNRLLLLLGVQPLFSEVGELQVYGRKLRLFGQGGIPVGHLRLYTKPALVELLGAAGFRMVDVRGAPYHDVGTLMFVEQIVAAVPNLAMILVICAQSQPVKGPRRDAGQ